MTTLTMNRRDWLRLLGASALAMPVLTAPTWAEAALPGAGQDHCLILIELEGGNDGLNTLVPYSNDRYRHARPTLSQSGTEVLRLDDDMGLHPALKGLAKGWERGQVRLVEGVGYPEPNRSHFRSIEIWNGGIAAHSKDTQGWISRLMQQSGGLDQDADGIALGGDMGPLRGPGSFTGLEEIDAFFEQAEALKTAGLLGGYDDASDTSDRMGHSVRAGGKAGSSGNPALDHLLSVHSNALGTASLLERKIKASSPRHFDMPDSLLGLQLSVALQLLDAGVTTPVMKVSLGGFDTHAGQAPAHEALLTELDQALTGFERAARDMGLWNRVTLMTYSEFGRRFYENGSEGTDHGTAAPVLITGGLVAGGYGGRRPSLEARDLVEDDMVFTTDFRSLYAGIARDLWNLDPALAVGPGFKPEQILHQREDGRSPKSAV